MTEMELKNGLTEQIVEESFNACLCLELLDGGEYRAVYVNKAFERMFAVSREKVCTGSFKERVREKYGEEGLAGFEKLLGASGEARMETWYDGQKKKYLWVSSFCPMERYLCLLFLDMTGFERSREKVERMYEEI